jgi:PAS domain-containing protein
VYANAAAASLTMAESTGQMVGTLITDFVHPAAILSALTAPGDSGQASAPVMSVLLRCDGTTLDIEATTVATPWEGRPAHQTVLRAVTTPIVLHSNTINHELHVRHAPEAIITATVDGLITGWNIAAERLFGRSVADSLGQLIRDALGVELDVVAIAAEGRARDLTCYTLTGGPVAVRVSVAAVDTGYILICTDRADALDTTQHYQSVVTSLDRGIVVINRDGTIASINPAAIRIRGPGGGRFPSTHAERALDYPVSTPRETWCLPRSGRPTSPCAPGSPSTRRFSACVATMAINPGFRSPQPCSTPMNPNVRRLSCRSLTSPPST